MAEQSWAKRREGQVSASARDLKRAIRHRRGNKSHGKIKGICSPHLEPFLNILHIQPPSTRTVTLRRPSLTTGLLLPQPSTIASSFSLRPSPFAHLSDRISRATPFCAVHSPSRPAVNPCPARSTDAVPAFFPGSPASFSAGLFATRGLFACALLKIHFAMA